MGDSKRLISLTLLMVTVAILVGATAFGVFYKAAFQREEQWLATIAQSHARLIAALAPARWSEIVEEQQRLQQPGGGHPVTLQLARREGNAIVALTPAHDLTQPNAVRDIGPALSEPMSRALSGQSGAIIAADAAGHRVLAAYEPVPALGLGLVATIRMAEINDRYLQAGLIASLVGLAVVLGASLLFLRLGAPMLRRLRESNDRYRTLVEAQPDPICQFLPDTTLTFVNHAYAEFYGRRPEELIGKRWLDFAAAEERPRFLEELASFTPAHPARHEETRSTGADGKVRWYLCHLKGVFDAAGKLVAFQTFGTDITARKRAEESYQESERRARDQLLELETIYRTVPIGLALFDRALNFVRVNSALADIHGVAIEDHLGRHAWDVMPHLRDTAEPHLRRVLQTGATATFEMSGESAKVPGQQRSWVAHCYPLHGTDGSVVAVGAIVRDVTERRRVEAALRESEARFRGTFENAAVGISNIGMDGAWLRVNQRLCDIVGYSRSELIQKSFQEITYPEDLSITFDKYRRLLRGEIDSYRLEKRYVHKNGTLVWVNLTAALQRDANGQPTYCIAIIEDISARKHVELALRESELRMRAILDASQDEILLLSTTGEVLAINEAAHRRLARRTGGADLVGVHIDRLLPQEQAESRMAIVRQVAETAELIRCEREIRGRWFEFWFYPVLKAAAQVSEVAVYAREVTHQRKSQADLSKLFQAIQQSPMSVVITDRYGNIEYVNPEFCNVTGYTVNEVLGQNPRVLKSGHTQPELYVDLWETVARGGVWRGELLNKKKNGELYWEIASIAPVKEGEKIVNFVAVKEDITQRKEIEEQLRHSQTMQALGQLTGGIAHDFNNLLAIIIGNLELLGERVAGDRRTRECLHDALWSARRGGELTRRLLAFARRQPLKPAVIDLNGVIRGMIDLLRRTLGARIHIEEVPAAELWKAVADRSELERAVVNLAVNARDAMQGTGTLTIETRNAVLDDAYAEQYEEVIPGEYAMIAITDTGAGMPPEVLQRVFEPFFTTKDVGQGSGLGLSMVYGFVKQSGGHVSIYSRVGQGTSVKLYLPRVPAPQGGRAEERWDLPTSSFNKELVLVVEDEPKLRKVAVKMLERMGLRSLQAENARDAIDLLSTIHPDVLFTDIELPGGMNGTELADVVHEIDPSIKVLFTTGYAREGVLHERWLEENVPWLLKPYSQRELARELKSLLTPLVM